MRARRGRRVRSAATRRRSRSSCSARTPSAASFAARSRARDGSRPPSSTRSRPSRRRGSRYGDAIRRCSPTSSRASSSSRTCPSPTRCSRSRPSPAGARMASTSVADCSGLARVGPRRAGSPARRRDRSCRRRAPLDLEAPARASGQAITELEFHISPVATLVARPTWPWECAGARSRTPHRRARFFRQSLRTGDGLRRYPG